MHPELPKPDPAAVTAACTRFDREDEVVEKALSELFAEFPNNQIESHILLKVVALNRLYSTGILAVRQMAAHICKMGDEVDAALAAGSPEIVDRVAAIWIKTPKGLKSFNFFSFATKYCSWHRQDCYPIYDSRVEEYLWALKRQGVFHSDAFRSRQDLWTYSSFRRIVTSFMEAFDLTSFSFKQIDKFLWSQGEALTGRATQPEEQLQELELLAETAGAAQAADQAAIEHAKRIGFTQEEIKLLK